jgi:hypothetical protein
MFISHLRHEYGVSFDTWSEALIRQCGRCAVCLKKFMGSKTEPHSDHSHKTGEFRGLLCARCNYRVGLYEDRVLMAAIETYLKQ